jgi:hypothetical protein
LIAIAAGFLPLPAQRRIGEALVALVTGAPASVLAPAPSAALVKVELNVVPLGADSPALDEAAVSAVDAGSAVEACEEVEACEAAAADVIGNGQSRRTTSRVQSLASTGMET